MKQATIDLLLPFVDQTLTITCDNGKEFAKHIAIAQALDANVYFAHPQAAWELGTNENANCLIRQYFPKGTDFAGLTDSDIDRVLLRLNHRPQKCLGGLFTRYGIFSGNGSCTYDLNSRCAIDFFIIFIHRACLFS